MASPSISKPDTHPVAAHRNLLGLELQNVAPERYLSDIIEWSERGIGGYCCIANVHQCVLVHDNADFKEIVNAARLVVPDSVILQRALSLRQRVPFVAPMRGSDIMLALCRRASQSGVKIALIGGATSTALETLKRRLNKQFSALEIVYSSSPPFRPLREDEVTRLSADLNRSGAQLVFVGLGCPKQEKLMAQLAPDLNAILIGVGAAFDFNAGLVRSSPKWVHKIGLEWLYRLVQEPRRLWRRYATTSPRFVWLILLDWLKDASARKSNQPIRNDVPRAKL